MKVVVSQKDEIEEGYKACIHQFCSIVSLIKSDNFILSFSQIWSCVVFFILRKSLCEEDSKMVHSLALYFLTNDSITLESPQKFVLLTVFTSHLEDIEDEALLLNLFELCFRAYVQNITENEAFCESILQLFDPFFCNSSDKQIYEIYHFLKDKSFSIQEIPTQVAVVSIFSFFSADKFNTFLDDLDFLGNYLTYCLDSGIFVIQEAACFFMSQLNDEYLNDQIDNVYSYFLRKISNLIINENVSNELRLRLVEAFCNIAECVKSEVGGLLEIISKSEPFFSKENYDMFIGVQSIALRRDPTITDFQIMKLYQFSQNIFFERNDPDKMCACLNLINSIIQIKPQLIDITAAVEIAHFFLTSDSSFLIKTALNFLRSTVMVYRNNSDYLILCYKMIISFLQITEKTSSILSSIEIVALSTKYLRNFEEANNVFNMIFYQLQRERICNNAQLLCSAQMIVKYLNEENQRKLLLFIIDFCKTNEESAVVGECLYTLYKMAKFNGNNTDFLIFLQDLLFAFIKNELPCQKNSDDVMLSQNVCFLISAFFENTKNIIKFNDFKIVLVEYLLYFLMNKEVKSGITEHILGTIADAIEMGLCNTQHLQPLMDILNSKLINTSDTFVQQNICYLLYKLLKLDINFVLPSIATLVVWFNFNLEAKNNGKAYNFDLITNISTVFIEVYSTLRPNFPVELLVRSINEISPPFKAQSTKHLLEVILSRFSLFDPIEEVDFALFNSMNSLTNSSLQDLQNLKLNENDIAKINSIIQTLINRNPRFILLTQQCGQ